MSAMEKQLKEIARKAGAMFSSHTLAAIDQKEGHANYVTNIDREVETFLQESLTALLPGSRLIGEEKENDALTEEPTWIVDPVDGTTNLIHDYRMSAVSIALCEGKQPTVGLVYQPYTEELFWAEAGKGAFLNGKPIRVSALPLDRALVAFGTSPYNAELAEGSLRLALRFLHDCADLRRSGSAAVDLAYVACGRHDVFFELSLKPWDYAAGSLLVREAGGCFGMPLKPDGPAYDATAAILAANATCFEGAKERIENMMLRREA